jgi:hypothetical protein
MNAKDLDYEKILEGMEKNSLLILADGGGARLIGKLRGARPSEIGQLLGVTLKQVKQTIEEIREKISREDGPATLIAFEAGLQYGVSAEKTEQIIRDRPDTRPPERSTN